jgi:DNA-binding beta-propeller fold protein YncE
VKRNSSRKLHSFILLAIIFGSALIQTNIIKADQASYQYSLKWMHPDPYFIDVDSEGNVYVASRYNNNVKKFDSVGTPLLTWGGPGTDAGKFNDPEGIAVDSVHGFLYLTDSENNRVQKFNLNGVFKAKWGSYGSKNGEFNAPAGIAVDASGNVYVTDRENNRIQKFDANGIFLMKWGSGGNDNGFFKMPESIAVDSEGTIYVGDEENNRVQVFDAKGVFVRMLGTYGSQEGYFIDPEDVCVDKYGNVYVADSDNSRIQKFTSTGDFITSIGSGGAVDGKFNDPRGVAVDLSGNMYVADTENVRIQKFAPLTATLAMTVSDSQGEPLSAADIVSTSQPVGQTPLSGSTDSHGRALFRNVAPGSYTLDVSREGENIGTQNVDAEPGSTTRSNFVEDIKGNLRVTVKKQDGSPIDGAAVWSEDQPPPPQQLDGLTDSEGVEEFTNIKIGTYKIKAQFIGYEDKTETIEVLATPTSTLLSITLAQASVHPETKVVVRITESDGTPIEGVEVLVTPLATGARPRSGRTNDQGVSIINPEVGGDHTITVSKAGYGAKTLVIYVNLEQTLNVNLVLLPFPSVKVTVKEISTNIPLAGASVSSTLQSAGESPKTTDSSGKVTFNGVDPGSYTITVTLAGSPTVTTGIFTIDYGDVKEITIFMEKPVAINLLKIIVVDWNNRPAFDVGLKSKTTPDGQGLLEGRTISEGICEFVGVKPGHYLLDVRWVVSWDVVDLVNGRHNSHYHDTDSSGHPAPTAYEADFDVANSGITEVKIVLSHLEEPDDPRTIIDKIIHYFSGSGHGLPCIIATATYGGPYAPEVLYMRHVRDDLIGSNDVGKVLVSGWNRFYYLWSPPIAYSISGSSQLRSVFTVLLLPLLGSMHVVAFVFENIAVFSPELASVISFLTAAVMATTIYVIFPIILFRALLKRIFRNSHNK